MKFTKFVLLAAAIMACACEKEMLTDTVSETAGNMTRTTTEMLSFASVEEMEEQIGRLRIMTPEELTDWYAAQGFESQYHALYRAAEEIDNATTLEEAEAIKAKYTPYFLYNDNPADEEPFNPYLPSEKPDYAYICNINGEVLIGSEVVNYNTITDVKDTHEYQLTHAPETRADNITQDNILKRTAGKHKFWAEGRMDQNEIVSIEFTAHKKSIFGWNKCQMSYHIRLGRWGTNDGWRSYSPWFLQFKENTPDGAWTKKLPSHTFVAMGRPKYNQTGVMNLLIYSKGTGSGSEGNLRLYYTSTKQ